MKSIMRFFSIAALAAAMATMVGCTKEGTDNANGPTCSTVVKLPEGGSKAITGDGHKTFVAGDRIKMYEQLPSGNWSYGGKSLALTSADISADGKATRFTFPAAHVPPITAGKTWRFVYPGEYIDEVNEPGGGSGIHWQTGNLSALGSTYDYAKYDITFVSDNQGFPSRIKLENQYAILKLIIKNSVGTDITSSITKIDIANSNIPYNSITNSSNIQVSRGTDPGPIYIAMYPTSNDIEFSARDTNYVHGGYYFTRTKTVTGKTLQAGHLYPVELTMSSANVTLNSGDITTIGQYGYGYMGGIYVMAEDGATWTVTDGGNGPTVISINNGDVRFESDYGRISQIVMTGFTKGGGDLPSGWTESDGTITWSGTPSTPVYMAYGTATLTAGNDAQIVFTVQ